MRTEKSISGVQEKKREAARREAEVERNAKAASAEKANNRLKRQTPFMCEVRFRNDLPQVRCDLKSATQAACQLTASESLLAGGAFTTAHAYTLHPAICVAGKALRDRRAQYYPLTGGA